MKVIITWSENHHGTELLSKAFPLMVYQTKEEYHNEHGNSNFPVILGLRRTRMHFLPPSIDTRLYHFVCTVFYNLVDFKAVIFGIYYCNYGRYCSKFHCHGASQLHCTIHAAAVTVQTSLGLFWSSVALTEFSKTKFYLAYLIHMYNYLSAFTVWC